MNNANGPTVTSELEHHTFIARVELEQATDLTPVAGVQSSIIVQSSHELGGGRNTFWITPFCATDLMVLGRNVSKFSVSGEPVDNRTGHFLPTRQDLEVRFSTPISLGDARSFIADLAPALTTALGLECCDNAHYGTPWVEIDGLHPIYPEGRHYIEAHMSMTSQRQLSVDAALLEGLRAGPREAEFADGMRAGAADDKFRALFLVLDVFAKEKAGIPPMPSKSVPERGDIDRAALLNQLGITSVDTISGPVPVDAALCLELRNQRNALSHEANSHLDTRLLYGKLLPLVRAILRLP